MSASDDILGRSARALAKGIRDGELSSLDVTRAYLEQIHATEPALHAYRCVTSELALAQAQAVDRARASGASLGPLAGVPVALKDIFVTQGVETTCGSAILAGWVPPYQGTHAQRLADAGAVLLGKLSMDEFGMGSANENTPFEPVHNPWARDHVPGGSSGGTAAAVAARSCALGLGSDTGGSIRQPASLCNLVGLKPTYGRVSRHGMIAFASSLDQAGPMTREVGDAALALGVLAGVDPRDSTSLDAPVPDYLAAVDAGAQGQLAGTTIGLHRRALELDGLAPQVRDRFEASLAQLADAGARVIDIELPHFEHAVATYYVLCTAEASSNLARYDGVRYGLRRDRPSLRETYEATRHDGFGAEVARRILLGTFVLRADSYADYYGRAMKVRSLIAQDYAAAFARCDMIASPTSPVPSWRIGAKVDDPLAVYLLDVFTIGANLAGLPAISIPAGFTASAPRLPIGLQLIGPRLAEPALLRVAAAHEAANRWHLERPPASGGGS
ncbi:Aspartyl-tRNA(Asn) amidotransferase subunit A [Enhygromyxa salina]|uniref:Glutamyl-tRNA(Gln) amidotransferase subunit A n=1 Tax=Enhygromyxa salina TaxID=215803 RepID=A0A0C2CY33_9BACT|nr:Aspartyl-tRNA(Asn) amidotransferase subunit A [Enhygromyxa salina]